MSEGGWVGAVGSGGDWGSPKWDAVIQIQPVFPCGNVDLVWPNLLIFLKINQ